MSYVQQFKKSIVGSGKKNVFVVNGTEYTENELISEGGYGYVYRVSRKHNKNAKS